MALPAMTAQSTLRSAAPPAGLARASRVGVEPQSCSMTKKIACGAAFVACGASCYLGPEVCVPCLAAVGGGTDCLACLVDW